MRFNHGIDAFCRVVSGCFTSMTLSGLMAACASVDDPCAVRGLPEPISEEADVATAVAAWSEANHVSISSLAARRWALPSSRVNTIGDAADDPDSYEAGLDSAFNQQWSHAYIYSALGFWIWGDADENFDDCITGKLAGQPEGPECKDGKSAAFYYGSGNQRMGDTYLGYATHYIQDASQVLHASDPSLLPDMVTNHHGFENWVRNNWTVGHGFQATVVADNYYYPVTELQQAVRNAAWAGSYWNSSSPGRRAWDAYRSSGYPTAAGTGNADLVSSTRQMLVRASRYATGAIKYTLDASDEWDAEY